MKFKNPNRTGGRRSGDVELQHQRDRLIIFIIVLLVFIGPEKTKDLLDILLPLIGLGK